MTVSTSSTSLMHIGVVKIGLPHLNRLLRRHAVLRVHVVFDVFRPRQKKNASNALHCQ